jgi:hypothetical protein
MTVNVPGIVIVVIAAAVGGALMVAAPNLGISEQNALPFGLLCAGIVACLISAQQSISGNPNSIFFPVWMYGTGAAIVGLLGMIGIIGFSDAPPLSREEARKLDSVTETLKKSPTSGSNRKGGEVAQRLRGAVQGQARKMGGGEKVNLHVDLGSEGEKIQAASLFVRVEGADRIRDDDVKGLLSFCMKLLQTEFPNNPCNVAIQGANGWVGHARARGPNMPGVPVVGSDPPRF